MEFYTFNVVILKILRFGHFMARNVPKIQYGRLNAFIYFTVFLIKYKLLIWAGQFNVHFYNILYFWHFFNNFYN